MTGNDTKREALAEQAKALADELAGGEAPPSGSKPTYRALAELADGLAAQDGLGHRKAIEALCRKIHVAKRVDAAYGPGWKKLDDRVDIDARAWPVIVGLVLGFSDPAAWGGPEAEGLAMKCLNAALAAMDIAKAAGAEGLDEFESELADALTRISGGATK